jgi:large subunit ribosomal protein LP0
MPAREYSARKVEYFERLTGYFANYCRCLMVTADNVGSFQMQQVRKALRGRAVVCFGKNTMMRTVLKKFLAENPDSQYVKILPEMTGNTGLIFTNEKDLGAIKDTIIDNVVPAPAKQGTVAPVDVFVPPGLTGMDPGQTAFFQVLSIPTKIARGQIEIINEVHLVKKGEVVTAGDAALLQKLDITPFSYGLLVAQVYDDGAFYSAAVLDLSMDNMRAKLHNAARHIAAVSYSIAYPSKASIGHHITNAYQKLCCLALELGVEDSFPNMCKTLGKK